MRRVLTNDVMAARPRIVLHHPATLHSRDVIAGLSGGADIDPRQTLYTYPKKLFVPHPEIADDQHTAGQSVLTLPLRGENPMTRGE